ncbi:MAG: DNA-directed RNA polymerase subunit beta [Planctomycetes bacterium]|nr:DNA-directed RNA polymerase subunit beta [Planctomycetota bacterium]
MDKIRYYGKAFKSLELPDLMETQRKFYAEFLQADVPADQRKNDGLEAVFREMFPIESYDGTMSLEYLGYQLTPPRYTQDECRQLKQTYGAPLKIHLRVNCQQPTEEWVYLGEMPLMIGGGEFIVNGAERVIVTQIQRSPGVDFSTEVHSSGKVLHSARIIPERGSWITVETTSKDELVVRIDRSSKIAATMFLRALAAREVTDENGTVHKELLMDTDADIIRHFYNTEDVEITPSKIAEITADADHLPILVSEITENKEVLFATGVRITEAVGKAILEHFDKVAAQETEANGKAKPKKIEILPAANVKDELILNTLGQGEKRFDESHTHDEAIMQLFKKLRPGTVLNQSKAWEVFRDRFFDESRYNFGEIGRFRINRKFGANDDRLIFTAEDFANVCDYIIKLRSGKGEIDDIDHLENRRLRTIKDLVVSELRTAWIKLRRSIREQMAIKREEEVVPHQLINVPTFSSAVEYFFARGELSQVVDQSNPLSQMVHERRLSALGPNGLNRKRAGFEVRDVHTSHYGRICPIETPEGANIGLIVSLATYAKINDMGFLITPYLLVKNKRIITEGAAAPEDGTVESIEQDAAKGPKVVLAVKGGGKREIKLPVVTGENGAEPVTQQICVKAGQKVKEGDMLTLPVVYLRADQEKLHYIGQADIKVDAKGNILPERPICRHREDFQTCLPEELSLLDVAPKQLVGVSASLIPFLEHDDTSRALMGSNMQRQAVPLVVPDKPMVATGMEEVVVRNTGMVQRAKEDGVVTYADCLQIRTTSKEETSGERVYRLHKYKGLNDGTTLNQQPIVRVGDKVKVGDPLTDGAATRGGALALGINTRIAFISWEGCNFEDAVIVSEEMIARDAFTSVHIEEFSVEIRETKSGSEEITRDIPGVSEAALANLDQDGLAYIGTKVKPGDILVGKISPKAKTEYSSEEKLLRAIFGRAGEDVKNDSLTVPPGTEGYVIKVVRFSRRKPGSDDEKKNQKKQLQQVEEETKSKIVAEIKLKFERLRDLLGGYPVNKRTGKELRVPRADDYERLVELQDQATLVDLDFTGPKKAKATAICIEHDRRIEFLRTRMDVEVGRLKRGDDLKPGVLELVKVYVAVKRKLSVGDKMAGRHGNKGVVSRILPVEDMPFLEDGTPMQMILNPLGIPSRMNVGQVLEIHLGWAASKLGFRAITPVFEGATEAEVVDALKEAGLPEDGKAVLYDGRTGERFHETVTCGYMYFLKLHHLVAEKIHARATGPYSLITQQPLGGKARNGGQRFGEMEVWAIEAYGAAHILQELLTVKSDDVDGRTKIYEAMVKGENSVEPGMPVSFDVLCNEIRGIGINLRMEKSTNPLLHDEGN